MFLQSFLWDGQNFKCSAIYVQHHEDTPPCRNRLVPSCASLEVTLNGCSFPLFVIPGLTRNPVFLSLKDQKIALPEQRVSNLEKENDLLKQYE